MSCAAEKHAFLMAMLYQRQRTGYCGTSQPPYSAPTALQQAYQQVEQTRPSYSGGARESRPVTLQTSYTPQRIYYGNTHPTSVTSYIQPEVPVITPAHRTDEQRNTSDPTHPFTQDEMAQLFAPVFKSKEPTQEQQTLERLLAMEKDHGRTRTATHHNGP